MCNILRKTNHEFSENISELDGWMQTTIGVHVLLQEITQQEGDHAKCGFIGKRS